jgi:polynucleotide 5'-hydroxyl-kinase GRC3/NOL9
MRASKTVPSATIGKTLPNVKLSTGRTLLLEGPASVRAEDGEGTILGAPLSQEWTIVRDDWRIPIEPRTEMILDVRLSHGSKYTIVEGSTIPTGWREAAQIVQQSPGTVIILGEVDSGKSSLCTLLANESLGHGLGVEVIDGDIGQADIGPPATISSSKTRHQVFSLQDLTPDKSLFMGNTSPSTVSDKLIHGLVRLGKEAAASSDVLLVNTDGWIQEDEALRHKTRLLDELRPDLVLGIFSDRELDPLLELQATTSLKLGKSPYARPRSREERKRAREFGYRRFLQKANPDELRLSQVRLRRYDYETRPLRLNGNQNLRGVLAGLLDEEEELLSIGRVERFADGLLSLTTVTREHPAIVELGAIVLSPQLEEIGFDF